MVFYGLFNGFCGGGAWGKNMVCMCGKVGCGKVEKCCGKNEYTKKTIFKNDENMDGRHPEKITFLKMNKM